MFTVLCYVGQLMQKFILDEWILSVILCRNHRIIKSFMLEKTLKFTKSNHHLRLPSLPLNHYYILKHHIHVTQIPQGWQIHCFPGQPVPRYPFCENILFNTQSKPSLVQLTTVSSRRITCHLSKETNTILTASSF